MVRLSQLSLGACMAALLTQVSFAQDLRYDWKDVIKLNPVGGVISEITSTSDIEGRTRFDDSSVLLISAKITRAEAAQCETKGVITNMDYYSNWFDSAHCTGSGSVSFTYTTKNGKSCRFSLEDGSASSNAKIVNANCSYSFDTMKHIPITEAVSDSADLIFSFLGGGYYNYIATSGNNIQQIKITDPSFETEIDISKL